MNSIPGLDFTAIDFESANSSRASACAAGIAVVRDGEMVETRSWLIQPHAGLDSFDSCAIKIHGITPQMVAGAMILQDATKDIAATIGDGPVLAHNMKYDGAVLRRSFDIAMIDQPASELRCTETLSRTARRLAKNKLHLMAEHLWLPTMSSTTPARTHLPAPGSPSKSPAAARRPPSAISSGAWASADAGSRCHRFPPWPEDVLTVPGVGHFLIGLTSAIPEEAKFP